MKVLKSKAKKKSITIKERISVQLQSGPTKAYVQRSPRSQKLKSLTDDTQEQKEAPQAATMFHHHQQQRQQTMRLQSSTGTRSTSKSSMVPCSLRHANQKKKSASGGGNSVVPGDQDTGGNDQGTGNLQWAQPIVNITHNDTIILPAVSLNGPTDHPSCPDIQLPSSMDSEDDEMEEKPVKRTLEGVDEETNLLLAYLKKGARPSITPMNSVDSASEDFGDEAPAPVFVPPTSISTSSKHKKPPSAPPGRSVYSLSSKSTFHVQYPAPPPARRPQVLKRISVGEDVNMKFCRGSRPPSSSTLPHWAKKYNTQVHAGGVRSRTSLPALPSLCKKPKPELKPMLRASSMAPWLSPSDKRQNRMDPSDDEIIDMYRKGLLSASNSNQNSRNGSNNTNFPPSTCDAYDSQFSSPNFSTASRIKEENEKAEANMAIDSADSVNSAGEEEAVRGLRREIQQQVCGDSESGIARSSNTHTTTTTTSGSGSQGYDSRKTSDGNCLQIPDSHVMITTSDNSESTSDGQLIWDSKSSTPALLEPAEFDSRPHSCTSSLADTSLMLENDDIASLLGSPFPGSKSQGGHPGLRRRSSSIDSAISRPGSDFLEVPQAIVAAASRDKVPCMLDSPGESPIASPVPSDTPRYSEDLQHQVVHRISSDMMVPDLQYYNRQQQSGNPNSSATTSSHQQMAPSSDSPDLVAHNVPMTASTSATVSPTAPPAVSLTTDDGDDFAVWFGRRGSIFIEERGQPQPPPPLQTTTDESGQVSLAVPRQK